MWSEQSLCVPDDWQVDLKRLENTFFHHREHRGHRVNFSVYLRDLCGEKNANFTRLRSKRLIG